MAALKSSETASAAAKPATVASVQIAATASHSARIRAGRVPASRMSVAEPIASGRLDT